MRERIRTLLALTVAAMLAACAAPARIEQMAVSGDIARIDAAHPLRGAVAVGQVSGGKETNPAWASEIGDPEFAEALSLSLSSAGLLRQGAAPYRLDAALVEIDAPVLGVSMTVTTVVDYALVNAASGALLARQTLSTPYTAAFSDSFYGVERARLAKEGSARANITAALDWLTRLPPQTFAAR